MATPLEAVSQLAGQLTALVTENLTLRHQLEVSGSDRHRNESQLRLAARTLEYENDRLRNWITSLERQLAEKSDTIKELKQMMVYFADYTK